MKKFPLLQTSRLILRKITEEDKDRIFLIRQDQYINRYMDRRPLESEKEALTFITKIDAGMKKDKLIYWGLGLKESSELIGTICLWNFSEDKTTAEIGYELLPDYQKKGLMTETMESVLEYGFRTLHLKEIRAYTARDNERSVKLLERLDFIETEENSIESENRTFTLLNEWE